ncbi:hypothetical protein ACJ72_03786 [Emergomyces africanus]|uniref:Uncharacterized protein n=1 Tax=Emergomyces africanus TaxID=1955775 RepID=A0A1B7NYP5_9EURO|nr:hypothetical protein ACJ72_03786 [Emergomyces africanus]
MSWATALATTAYYAIYPITITANLMLAVLQALATPWVHVALYIFHICIALPWQLFMKFEPLYIFLSIAGAVGVSAGISLHFFSGYMHQLLGISAESEYDTEYHSINKIIDRNRGRSYLINSSLAGKKYVTTTSDSKGLKTIMRGRDEPHQAENGNQERTGMRGMWRLPGFTNERAVIYPANALDSEKMMMHGKGIWEDENGNGRVPKKERNREDLFTTMILEEEGEEEEEEEEED